MKASLLLIGAAVAIASTPEAFGSKTDAQVSTNNLAYKERLMINRAAIRGKQYRWPHGRVPYVISSGFSKEERNMIARAMLEFHKRTCIRFVPRRNQRNYVNIGKHGSGCTSYVGMMNGMSGGQKVSLDNGCANGITTPIHELMHAIGFDHEQNRPDRDRYVNVYFENIEPRYRFAYGKKTSKEYKMLTPYDYESVMHYGSGAFALKGKTAMTRKNGSKQFGNKKGFTRYDILKIRRLYRCRRRG